MAGTKVKKGVCSACGVDVRPNAEFCYNCGEEVSVSVVSEEETGSVSNVWLKEDIQEEGTDVKARSSEEDKESNTPETKDNSGEDIETDDGEDVRVESREKQEETEAKADDPIPKPKGGNDKKMETAASLRKKARNRMVKQEEIVWEEYDKSPNILFLGVALVIVLGVVALFYIAMYLK